MYAIRSYYDSELFYAHIPKMGFWQMGVLPIAENTLYGSIFEGVNAMKNFITIRNNFV